jgi:ABC-2 type transport system permease protein
MTQSPTQTHTPTLMEKLLGKNYKWWYILKYYFKSNGTGLSGFLVSQIADIVQVLGITYIWIINNSPNQVITYLIIGRIFKSLSDCFLAEVVAPEVASGKISNYLMLPTPFMPFYFFREVGRRIVFNTGRAISLLIAVTIFFSYIDLKILSLNNLIVLPFLVVLSFVLSFFTEFIVGFSMSFFDDKRNYEGLRKAYNGLAGMGGILTGIIIPLDKLPLYKEFIQFLPTTFFLHHPMQIFLGKYNFQETLAVFAGGLAWCLILYFLAKFVFKLGLKKNEAVGL